MSQEETSCHRKKLPAKGRNLLPQGETSSQGIYTIQYTCICLGIDRMSSSSSIKIMLSKQCSGSFQNIQNLFVYQSQSTKLTEILKIGQEFVNF